MYAAEIAAIKKSLGIEHLDIRFEWYANKRYINKRKGSTGDHTKMNGWHRIRVATLGWSYEDVIKIIAHELRHAWQFGTGVCYTEWKEGNGRRRGGWVYTFTGTSYSVARSDYKRSAVKYRQRPEEIDAYAYQDDAWVKLFGGKRQKVQTPESSVAAAFLAALG